MGLGTKIFITILKIAPLGIYLRSSACKFELPVLGCDEALCPAAIKQPVTDDCMPTGNTAELKAWCEHGWTPWLNGLLTKAGAPALATCSEDSGYVLLKVLGASTALGYLLLWVKPTIGALWLTVYMGFGLHFHITFLKDPAGEIILQMVLFSASLTVLVLNFMEEEHAPVPVAPPKKKKAAKAD